MSRTCMPAVYPGRGRATSSMANVSRTGMGRALLFDSQVRDGLYLAVKAVAMV